MSELPGFGYTDSMVQERTLPVLGLTGPFLTEEQTSIHDHRRKTLHVNADGSQWYITIGSLKTYEGTTEYLYDRMRGSVPYEANTRLDALRLQVEVLTKECESWIGKVAALAGDNRELWNVVEAACRYHRAQSATYHRELGEAIADLDKSGVTRA